MIRWCDNGHPSVRVQSGRRCVACARKREDGRPSRQARGYGRDHANARAALVAMLPAACGYCGQMVASADTLAAAHVVDGQPEHGWMPSHRDCNERGKARAGGGIDTGSELATVPAPRQHAVRVSHALAQGPT